MLGVQDLFLTRCLVYSFQKWVFLPQCFSYSPNKMSFSRYAVGYINYWMKSSVALSFLQSPYSQTDCILHDVWNKCFPVHLLLDGWVACKKSCYHKSKGLEGRTCSGENIGRNITLRQTWRCNHSQSLISVPQSSSYESCSHQTRLRAVFHSPRRKGKELLCFLYLSVFMHNCCKKICQSAVSHTSKDNVCTSNVCSGIPVSCSKHSG